VSNLGWFHLATAIVSIITGAYVLLATRKGTRLHRQAGWVYVVAMLALNGTAMMIYHLFGRFGPFHVFALISLASVTSAIIAALMARRSRLAKDMKRRETWLTTHYHSTSWSYVGLIAALVSEAATRLPAFRPGPGQGRVFGIAVGVATLTVFGIGAWIILRRVAPSLKPFRATT
jgi:uncharacterized membrane protein